MGCLDIRTYAQQLKAGAGTRVQMMIALRELGLVVLKPPFPRGDTGCRVSDRCPGLITFSQCCKVRLTVLRETALSSAVSLSPAEEIEPVSE